MEVWRFLKSRRVVGEDAEGSSYDTDRPESGEEGRTTWDGGRDK
jgi:hypothetical protein